MYGELYLNLNKLAISECDAKWWNPVGLIGWNLQYGSPSGEYLRCWLEVTYMGVVLNLYEDPHIKPDESH